LRTEQLIDYFYTASPVCGGGRIRYKGNGQICFITRYSEIVFDDFAYKNVCNERTMRRARGVNVRLIKRRVQPTTRHLQARITRNNLLIKRLFAGRKMQIRERRVEMYNMYCRRDVPITRAPTAVTAVRKRRADRGYVTTRLPS